MEFKTEQEEFWNGEFGDQYIDRNKNEEILSCNLALFSKVLANTRDVNSVIEFGSNIGLNLKAITTLKPFLEYKGAIEINKKAADYLKSDMPNIKVYEQSILECDILEAYDFVLIKGVLIHINPDELMQVYKKLYETSKRYICIVEYYNPTPVAIPYRGFENKLFKRDFAGELMDQYKDLKLVDYGFVYHRDNNFKGDDLTWFLMEKSN